MVHGEIKNWLVMGIPKNWETALSQPVPIWGLRQKYQAEFHSMKTGDILWFYVTNPVKGIIGLGVVKDKYIDPVNLVWEEELIKKEVIWPLRFRIHVLKVLSPHRWKKDCIRINDFNLFWRVGFQILDETHVIKLKKRAERMFGTITLEKIFSGATISEPLFVKKKTEEYSSGQKQEETSHRKLQEQIAEIGKLQFYYSQIEYPLQLRGEKKNLDVIWKREVDGSPTFAFEIELSGSLERAVERLKFSFRKWNSRPRIIIPKEATRKLHNILTVVERDFAEHLKVYTPYQVIELLEKKRELRKMEQNLNMY